ncbi:MAG: hypothetical protein HYV42_02185 [Candidatus Magasanikbacteria bacterium]|nr:hypothetical protein [Candidatus Magasanikbacteria bacterium]
MPSSFDLMLVAWFTQSNAEVDRVWRELIVGRERLLATAPAAATRLWQYLEPIYQRWSAHDVNSAYWPADEQTIRLIEAPLLRDFIADPTSQEMRDALALEVMLVHAALGLRTDLTPYTPEELRQILFEEEGIEYYNDAVFAHTLRAVLQGGEMELMVPQLLGGLEQQAASGGGWGQLADWSGALLYALTLQAAWRYFPHLRPPDQQLLLTHYFWQAIACGVPVRERLQVALVIPDAAARAPAPALVKMLGENKELVAVDTAGARARPLIELIKEAEAATRGKGADAFRLEEFAGGIYRDQVGRDAFAGWLREAIQIVLRLRAGTLV